MERRGQCIAVVSGKGGTGKTSFVAGVGAALAIAGKRVLVIGGAGTIGSSYIRALLPFRPK